MSTSSNARITETSGPPVTVAARDQKLHPLVRLTSMHGTFVLESVGQWVKSDQARQEEGTPDSLDYLTRSMQFLMEAVRLQQDMGQLCRLEGGGQKAALIRAEATVPVLKEIGMDTADLEAGMQYMRAQSTVLESIADIHAGNADQVVQILNDLELRIHAVLHVGQPGSKPLSN